MIPRKGKLLFLSVSYVNSIVCSIFFRLFTKSGKSISPGYINKASLIFRKYLDYYGKISLKEPDSINSKKTHVITPFRGDPISNPNFFIQKLF